jgi:hypothetical protein
MDENKKLPKRHMYVGSTEVDTRTGPLMELRTNVAYFILPEEDFGAFVKDKDYQYRQTHRLRFPCSMDWQRLTRGGR